MCYFTKSKSRDIIYIESRDTCPHTRVQLEISYNIILRNNLLNRIYRKNVLFWIYRIYRIYRNIIFWMYRMNRINRIFRKIVLYWIYRMNLLSQRKREIYLYIFFLIYNHANIMFNVHTLNDIKDREDGSYKNSGRRLGTVYE